MQNNTAIKATRMVNARADGESGTTGTGKYMDADTGWSSDAGRPPARHPAPVPAGPVGESRPSVCLPRREAAGPTGAGPPVYTWLSEEA